MILDWIGEVGWDIKFANIKNDIDTAIQNKEEISVNLFSFGGSYYEGIAIYDYIKDKSVAINIYGMAASAAAIISAGAGTGKLQISDSAEFLIHQARQGVMGYLSQSDFADEAINMEKANDNIANIFAKRSGLEVEKVRDMLDNEITFTAKEAKDYGFVDSIISEKEEAEIENKFIDKVNRFVDVYNAKIEIENKKNDDSITKTKLNYIINNKECEMSEQANIPLITVDELKAKDALINDLKKQVENNKHTTELSEKEKMINSLQSKVENYEKAEQERINKIVVKTNSKTLEMIDAAGIEINDDIKATIENCKDVDYSNTINDLARAFNSKIENMKPIEGEVAVNKTTKETFTNKQVDNSISASDIAKVEKMIDKLLEEDTLNEFNNNRLRAYENLVSVGTIKENE